MQKVLTQWPSERMILLTHVKELIEQNYRALLKVWPSAPVGIFSAGLDRKEAYAPLVLGGIASVKNNIQAIGARSVLFIDEAHLLSPNEASMYQTVIAELQSINPYKMRVVGLSATPFRMGQGMITDGGLFTDIVYDITGVDAFNKLIDDRYLSLLIPKQTHNVIDVSDVREMASDYNQKDLCQTIIKQNITQRALAEAYDIARHRKSWIVFGAGIENCEKITDILCTMGVGATCVHSKMSDEQRDTRIQAFKNGYFQAIVSNNILTTGFDHPQVDCIVDLRPTVSVVLHVQKYGRGTRPYFHPSYNYEQLHHLHHRIDAIAMGGKENCIVLDFAGNTMRLGPINDPRIPRKKGKGTGEVPVKLCDSCGAYNHISARFCVDCGDMFIFKTKLKPSAETADIIRASEPTVKILPVTQCFPMLHSKPGKTPKLKLQYWSGFQMVNHWLDFEGIGFSKHKAHDWFRQMKGDDFPLTVTEALARFKECRVPTHIKVDTSGKYPEIVEFLFQ